MTISPEERLSWASLFLSLAAFIASFAISLLQVLQQYAATAEGYRICQEAILGPWTKYKDRKFRFRELRYETRYSTPSIELGAFWDGKYYLYKNHRALVGGESDLLVKLDDLEKPKNKEWVGWLQFLEELNTLHSKVIADLCVAAKDFQCIETNSNPDADSDPDRVLEYLAMKGPYLGFPSFVPEEHSWDFMPAEVLKPLARIGVSDLAICIRRLGLRWLKFDPASATLQAQGNNLILTSAHLSSLGCVVTLTRVSGLLSENRFPQRYFYIPCIQADAMGFGLLPSCPHRGFPEFFKIGSKSDIIDTMKRFGPLDENVDIPAKAAIERVDKLLNQGQFLHSFLDIIPLVAPFMRERGSQIVRIPAPTDRPSWIFKSRTGRTAFPHLLRNEMNGLKEKRLPGSYKNLEELLNRYREFERYQFWATASPKDHENAQQNNQEITFLDEVRKLWDYTEKFFDTLHSRRLQPHEEKWKEEDPTTELLGKPEAEEQARKTNVRDLTRQREGEIYSALVYVHLSHAVMADQFAEENMLNQIEENYPWPAEDSSRWWWHHRMARTLAQYKYRLEYMRDDMCALGYECNEVEFFEMWAHMMVRGFCWQHCHSMVEEPRVPSDYWKSKVPVYIG